MLPKELRYAPATADEDPTSGLRSVVLSEGHGEARPRDFDAVTIALTAWQSSDGRLVAGGQERPATRRVKVEDLFFGLSVGVQSMRVGERRRFWVHAPLVQGGRRWLPQLDLVLEVQLLSIHPGQMPPQVPEDVASVPPEAQATATGLRYRVLKEGVGTRRPQATSKVRLEYSAWTSQGVALVSSYPNGAQTVRVSDLFPGWAEGVQGMREGEVTRFWIPEHLAYEGRPGQPQGTIVIDVHLVAVVGPDPAPRPTP